jgi:hypothetical protein
VVLGRVLDPDRLGGVVVEGEADAGDVRQVRRDVAGTDLDLPVLHVLGMDEQDVVQHPSSFSRAAQTRPSKSERVTRRWRCAVVVSRAMRLLSAATAGC